MYYSIHKATLFLIRQNKYNIRHGIITQKTGETNGLLSMDKIFSYHVGDVVDGDAFLAAEVVCVSCGAQEQ